MKRVLVIANHKALTEILPLLFSRGGEMEWCVVDGVEDACKKLRGIDLIICGDKSFSGQLSQIFQENIRGSNVPFVLVSNRSLENCVGFEELLKKNPKNRFIQRGVSKVDLLTLIAELLGQKKAYFPLPLDYLKSLRGPLQNLYLKLGDDKWVRVVENAQNFKELLDHHKDKTNTFYLPLEDAASFLRERLKDDNLIDGEKISLFHLNFNINRALLENLGLSSQDFEATYQTLDFIKQWLDKKKVLQDLLADFEKTGSFSKDHAFLSLLLCASMVRKMDILGPRALHKLGIAALFQHLFWHTYQFEELETLNREELKGRGGETYHNARSHVHHAVKILTPFFDDMGPDPLTIILEHHESPDGSGYPSGLLGGGIFALSAVFILAHRLALHLLLQGSLNSKAALKYLEKLPSSFRKGSFERAYKALADGFSL